MNKASRNPANGPQGAVQRPPSPAVGEPANAARKGVPSALRPDARTGDGRHPVAWLTITASRGAFPTATSTCACGRDRSAVGHGKVHALIADHTAHREVCPLRTPQEGRAAA
ncbi:hypothetical protein ABZX85_32960 [Streptomyces sp. NPDC004539]|uniref:hypothetical protein n=1 Tax=Streptomyces sp. NPDC004539 TaxID=3154280 RepID=UPI0033A0E8F9